MIEGFYNWIKNIAFFYILITMVMNLLPNNSYRKYIKFFTGLLLVIVVATPILELFGLGGSFEDYFRIGTMKEELSNIEGAAKGLSGIQLEEITKGYKLEIERQVRTIVEARGLYPMEVDVTLDMKEGEGMSPVKAVFIAASREKLDENSIVIGEVMVGQDKIDSMEEINIKNDIEDVYNISASNINISIQR
jgi:stage III sporulation protein AF